ncbi:hypothetical protein LCGC14_0692920 [marine sediment metagenome]|uniref:Uncharacterized protein n=1 Tax=marine sediment metagenome TaxID=412755 RepID=A0A0F9QK10_9ZZZZ
MKRRTSLMWMLAVVLALMAALMVGPMFAPVAAGGEDGALMVAEGPYGLEPASGPVLEQTFVMNGAVDSRAAPYGFDQFSDLQLGYNIAGAPSVDMTMAPYGPEHIILSSAVCGLHQPVYYPLFFP